MVDSVVKLMEEGLEKIREQGTPPTPSFEETLQAPYPERLRHVKYSNGYPEIELDTVHGFTHIAFTNDVNGLATIDTLRGGKLSIRGRIILRTRRTRATCKPQFISARRVIRNLCSA